MIECLMTPQHKNKLAIGCQSKTVNAFSALLNKTFPCFLPGPDHVSDII